DAYRAMIPTLVAQKNTAQSPVIVVDQYAGFDPDADTYDSVHPDAVGEKKVAGKFFAAIQALVGPAALVAKTTTPPPPPPPVLAHLSGFVFNDATGDGVRDAGEAGLAGRFVYLDFNITAVREANEPVVVTNANGRYLFKSLAAGNYRVRHHV